MSTSFHHSHSFFKRRAPGLSKGFTLVELLVVVSIVVVITALLLVRQSRFNSSTLLRSLAYSIALSVRQAQVYGISVRETGPSSGIFSASYGIYFDYYAPERYILFADKNSNGRYDPGEDVQVFTLGSGYTVLNVCGIYTAGGNSFKDCPPDIAWVTVSFKRPNPDGLVSTDLGRLNYVGASVQIQAPGGDTRTITITSTGQITVGQDGS